uniref:Zinc finger CCCH domain-containing protein 7 isoform X1 n=1 Tax=Cymbidium ensifolium TaxID=78740 RepID=A0A5J6N8Y8_CYMEN|nr:zinc finger CCCH domain-containing protein 7 isoform X1 [Cymbidium ensifolium]QEX51153.1 zinc finger CCCH domain-containing protein 7 isoform X2 [Cymbidium ensifolium]
MGSVLRRAEIDLETQNPPTRKFSSFSSYIPRRTHLDSSSYRSLVCILSHCANHSLVPLSPAQERTHSVKDPISSHGRGEFHQDQEAGANTDEGTSAEKQECDRPADGVVRGVSAADAELVGLDLSDFDEKEIEACVNSEELHGVMLECGRLIEASNEVLCAESHEGNGQALHEEIVHNENELEIPRASVNGAEERVSHLGEVLEVAKKDGRVCISLNEDENTWKIAVDVGNLVGSELVEGTDNEKALLIETQDENSIGAEEEGKDKKQQTDVYATSLVDYSGLRNLRDGQVRTLAHQIDGAEVEEGEISDDAQDLEYLVDINDNDKVPEDQKKEGQNRDDIKEVASTTLCIHRKEVTELGASLLDTLEEDSRDKATQNKGKVVGASERKKCGILAEERKAKKKIAKKRKRAQKNREQGVKKLKLHAVVKPKEVKYCNFYRMGRCQQGELCKFSHDTTPLTKSTPCKYFACNSCLRGDGCPYDHELSKYPCINYMSTGNCNRGDRCKFSHKIPTTDASSQLTIGKLDLHLTSGQPMLRNQPFGTHASPLNIGSFEGKTEETVPLRHKPLKETNRIPKGIRFISFGTVQTNLSNKVKESFPVNKSCHTGAYDQQTQDDLLVLGHQSTLTLSWNSLPPKKSIRSSGLVDVSSNGIAVKDSGNVTKGSPVTHLGGIAKHEVSEAAKILEEFLFCGAG